MMNHQSVRTSDALSGEALLRHVRALAVDIGPRPAGSQEEARARAYIRRTLSDIGITHGRDLPFKSPDTWGWAAALPVATLLLSNLLPGKLARLLGVGAGAVGVYSVIEIAHSQRSLFTAAAPTQPTSTLVVRIPPEGGQIKHKVVLVGHTDTNKHRLTFMPENRRWLTTASTIGVVVAAANLFAQLLSLLGLRGAGTLRALTTLAGIGVLGTLLADELGGFVDGANDNASAVACLLGIAAHLRDHPLKNTEVWLAFTGAEETGCLGMHELLDAYPHELSDAWFIDFEMVGAGDIVYVTEHSSLTRFTPYTPDSDSLAWALETARRNPELGVRGAPMTITEEVGALRGRGYRGICIAGQGRDGWLPNWHQYSDNIANIQPQPLETAARFAWAMLQSLDNR